MMPYSSLFGFSTVKNNWVKVTFGRVKTNDVLRRTRETILKDILRAQCQMLQTA